MPRWVPRCAACGPTAPRGCSAETWPRWAGAGLGAAGGQLQLVPTAQRAEQPPSSHAPPAGLVTSALPTPLSAPPRPARSSRCSPPQPSSLPCEPLQVAQASCGKSPQQPFAPGAAPATQACLSTCASPSAPFRYDACKDVLLHFSPPGGWGASTQPGLQAGSRRRQEGGFSGFRELSGPALLTPHCPAHTALQAQPTWMPGRS